MLTVLQWLLCHRVCLKKTTWLSVKGSPVTPACHINFNNSWSLESIRQIDVDVQFKLMEPDKLHVCLYVPEMKTPDIWDPVFCPEEEICVLFLFFLNFAEHKLWRPTIRLVRSYTCSCFRVQWGGSNLLYWAPFNNVPIMLKRPIAHRQGKGCLWNGNSETNHREPRMISKIGWPPQSTLGKGVKCGIPFQFDIYAMSTMQSEVCHI